ncbi:MAG TPA: AAA family ATPase [Lacipirellulaceae bacterium]|jgi:pilus assembly protein CpaE|nr:AAA family ATPase [Lacipirellulaceae bacterium]
MASVLRIAIVDPKDATRESLKSMLLGLDSVWLEAECSRYEFFGDVVGQTSPDVGFIALDSNPDKALDLIGSLAKSAPDCATLVTSSSTDGNLILRTMRAGAKEFLTQPLKPEDLAAALQRVSRQRFGSSGGSARGCTIIALTGATGGVGSTSVAVNLGCALAADPANSVVLLDLDLCLGDADVFLDSIPEYTLSDVAQNISRLDLTLLKRSLTKHDTGLYLLPRPVQLEDARLISSEELARVLGLLKASFTHVIVDTSKGFNALDMQVLAEADSILLVTQLDLPCLRNVVRLLASFKEHSKIDDKVKIVVNRAGYETGQISLRKAQETIGREIYWQVPNDYRVMVEVRNNGVPLIQQAPRAAITQSINQLAATLAGKQDQQPADASGKSRSWLGLWPART